MKKLKILVIDPWCEKETNIYRYSTGLMSGLANYSKLTLASPYSFPKQENIHYSILQAFFKFSSKMKRSILRKAIRGTEYIFGYVKILRYVKKENFDVIHVEWPLMFKADARFWKKLKSRCKLFVVKAHNVLPHSTGEKYIEEFRQLYGIADIVLIHGKNIEREFTYYFPEYSHKLIVQQYGSNMSRDISYNENLIEDTIKSKISQASIVFFFFGDIHEDKGLDRLINIWLERFVESDSLLIISGRVDQNYSALASLKQDIYQCNNIVYLEGYISDNDLNYYLSTCDLVVLPYRKAYMSAVVFTCAEFKKTFLSTDFGAVSEYTENDVDSFIVQNDDESLKNKLVEIAMNTSKNRLKEMGEILNNNFNRKYKWDEIGRRLILEYENYISNHFPE